MEIKSSTINKIMLGTIVVLCIICVVFIIKIKNRPRIAAIEDAATALGMEQTQEEQDNSNLSEAQPKEEEKDNSKQVVVTTSRVNIRDRDSEDGRVLTTVEAGEEFDFIEVLGNGWTKIMYDGQEAYIISDCITLKKIEENSKKETKENDEGKGEANNDQQNAEPQQNVDTPQNDASQNDTPQNDVSQQNETPQQKEDQPGKLEIIEITPQ